MLMSLAVLHALLGTRDDMTSHRRGETMRLRGCGELRILTLAGTELRRARAGSPCFLIWRLILKRCCRVVARKGMVSISTAE